MKHIHLAGCIIQDDKSRILLLHRNTPKRTQWEIPGGKVEPGEDLQSTAQREVLEELGVRVKVLRQLGERSFDEDGYTMTYTWFSARMTGGVLTIKEPHIHDEYRYFARAELGRMARGLSPNVVNFLAELRAGNITL